MQGQEAEGGVGGGKEEEEEEDRVMMVTWLELVALLEGQTIGAKLTALLMSGAQGALLLLYTCFTALLLLCCCRL